MKQYKVKALTVSGLKNRIYRSGDTVTEENFPPGNADDLVKKGYLTPIGEDSLVPKNDVSLEPEFIKKEELANINDLTVAEIKSDLKNANIEFPKNASKVELYALWVELRK